MVIETVKDYIEGGCFGDFLFKSTIVVRGGGADIYRICGVNDTYLCIEPINGKKSEHGKVHVLRWQHLEDSVFVNLIDEGRIKELLSEGIGIYNDSKTSLSDVENWVKSFSGEEYKIANSFYESMRIRNQKPSTFRWRINDFLEEEIFKEISSTRPQ